MFKLLTSLLITTFTISALGQLIEQENEVASPDFNVTDLEVNAEKASFAFFPLDDFPIRQSKRFFIGSYLEVNWYRAQLLCAAQGLTLASLNSAAERNQLQRQLDENNLQNAAYWLSGTNLPGLNVNNNWFWMSNGRPLNYANWAQYEPNSNACHCLLKRPNGEWAAEYCQNNHLFICENRCPLDSYNVPTYTN